MALGIWLHPPTYADYGEACDKQVTVTGRVYAKEFQKWGDSHILLLYIAPSALMYENRKIPYYDNFICRMEEESVQPFIGSNVTVTGVLTEPEEATNPGQFNAQLYYATLDISAHINKAKVLREEVRAFDLREILWQLRCRLSEGIDGIFAQEDAGILKAMLLGDKSALSADIKALYKKSGILHILAISGLHISFLGMGLKQLLYKLRLPKKPALLLCAVVMILYGIMVGMPVSAFRAVFMFLLNLLAEWTGRTYDGKTALALSAILLLLKQPLYIINAGFLLSFLAVTAILYLKPLLQPPLFLFWKNLSNRITARLDGLTTSLAILFFTLPVQLYFYYETTVYAPLFNLLVLPLTGLLLVLAAGAVCVWWLLSFLPFLPFLPFLSKTAAVLAHGILWTYENVGKTISAMPGAILTVGAPKLWQIVCYFVLLSLVLLVKKLAWRYRVGLLCGAFLLMLLPHKPTFVITMLDVGQGQCVCVQLPNGETWLYDGGSLDKSQVGEYRLMPYLKSQGINKLSAVFLSHGDADHINGIREVLEDAEIAIELLVLPLTEKQNVYRTKSLYEEGSYGERLYGERGYGEGIYNMENGIGELAALAASRRIPILWLEEGMAWESAGVSVQCLHPGGDAYNNGTLSIIENGNEGSMVLYLTYGNFSMLLTGDVEKAGEDVLLAELQEKGIENVTVLQVAHHGSKNASSAGFLEQVAPRIALISCGKDNSYGHPHEEVLERLLQVGCKVLTTVDCGAVEIQVGQTSTGQASTEQMEVGAAEQKIIIRTWK